MAMLIDPLVKSVLPFIIFFRMASHLWFKLYFRIFKRFEYKTNGGKYWAVVTGSTDGIGFEFARQLAAKNYNILMISRNAQKLEEKRQAILNEHFDKSIQIKTLAVDFKRTDIYDEIKQFLGPHLQDIFILVNNVGSSMGINNYADEDANGHKELVNINVISTLGMTDLILPTLISKKHGLIINMSSLASKIELPCLATYGATKAFITYFSRALYHECKAQNVLIFNLITGTVTTKLSRKRPDIFTPTPDVYVANALETVSWENPENCGYFRHTIQFTIAKLVETIVGWRIIGNVLLRVMKLEREKFLASSKDN